jgi:sortase (surface protein transpeptidase)
MTDGADETGSGSGSRKWTTFGVALLLLAAWLVGHNGGGAAPAAAPRALPAAANDHPPRIYAPHEPMTDAVPRHLDIGSIGIHADLVGRGLTDGTIDPPPYDTPEVAGWYQGGPTPGADGAALIVGHVDTETSPAVFYGLSTVQRGAAVDVTRDDGTIAEFSVEAVEVVEKDHFDATRVYGSSGRPELRLITCGGTFDRSAQSYSANVVVYAALTGSRAA